MDRRGKTLTPISRARHIGGPFSFPAPVPASLLRADDSALGAGLITQSRQGTRAQPRQGPLMNTEHQTLADVPFWLLVLLSMAGLSGEMLRASGSDLSLRQILQRVALRFLASGLLGMATLLLALALWSNLYLAAGLGIVIAVIGADVAGGLYTQILAKKAGITTGGRNDPIQ